MNHKLESSPNKQYTVGIIGGGIAGATIAIRLSELGIKVILLEKGKSLVNGPPICHLHAGGNLYREISDTQCFTLLQESIDLVQLYPQSVDYRPTLIAIPIEDKGLPRDLQPRLKKLQAEYQRLINENPKNRVLGDPKDYYKYYDRNEVEYLAGTSINHPPENLDEWMMYAAKKLDLDRLKFPLLMVQEYGLNIFRLAATANMSLENNSNCTLVTQAKVQGISSASNAHSNWNINYEQQGETTQISVSFLVNACGFKTGSIDDMLAIKRNRMVEFKAAYISKWDSFEGYLPEIIFHGTRGSKNGMAQLTPYPQGYFQIHGMTPEITLFKNGLVPSTKDSSQPTLNKKFISKIEDHWNQQEVTDRTHNSIQHIAQFIPDFSTAELGGIPLFGAQQIPGDDPDLRAANVAFSIPNYACCEIVKASSTLSAANAILDKLIQEHHIKDLDYPKTYYPITQNISETSIHTRSEHLCTERNYPIALASRISQKETSQQCSTVC
ncbi:MAG: FAD-dependent oxidoreductase [Flavobacteriaceae bacterium]|nr:MAG: FAD-dependent oxidoreductase [Flavobacteriaceae bacterium]